LLNFYHRFAGLEGSMYEDDEIKDILKSRQKSY
jgi:hypothetical protein